MAVQCLVVCYCLAAFRFNKCNAFQMSTFLPTSLRPLGMPCTNRLCRLQIQQNYGNILDFQ